jgi:hypothetical protein
MIGMRGMPNHHRLPAIKVPEANRSMGFLDWLKGGVDPEAHAANEASAKRHTEYVEALRASKVPPSIAARLDGARSGRLPWIATLTPAELLVTRSHGIRPISAVSATCWMKIASPWLLGHAHGWEEALYRLKMEAKAAGANAVLDVKMRSVHAHRERSMDFTLTGTAVRIDGLPASIDPVIATLPALEFVKLLDAGVVPTGIAIGTDFTWIPLELPSESNPRWAQRNQEVRTGTWLLGTVRKKAFAKLRESARNRGNGILAHTEFSEMAESGEMVCARYIVIATTVDIGANDVASRKAAVNGNGGAMAPPTIVNVIDMRAGKSPLSGTAQHHQPGLYSNE